MEEGEITDAAGEAHAADERPAPAEVQPWMMEMDGMDSGGYSGLWAPDAAPDNNDAPAFGPEATASSSMADTAPSESMVSVPTIPEHCRPREDDFRRAYKLVVDPELEVLARRHHSAARATEKIERWNGEGVRSFFFGEGGVWRGFGRGEGRAATLAPPRLPNAVS